MKVCGNCHLVKSLDNFHRNKQNADGLHSYCKSCRSINRREKNYQVKNVKSCAATYTN